MFGEEEAIGVGGRDDGIGIGGAGAIGGEGGGRGAAGAAAGTAAGGIAEAAGATAGTAPPKEVVDLLGGSSAKSSSRGMRAASKRRTSLSSELSRSDK